MSIFLTNPTGNCNNSLNTVNNVEELIEFTVFDGNSYDSGYVSGILSGSMIFGIGENWGALVFESEAYGDAKSETAPVPEPGTLLLLGFGLVGLVVYRKKTG